MTKIYIWSVDKHLQRFREPWASPIPTFNFYFFWFCGFWCGHDHTSTHQKFIRWHNASHTGLPVARSRMKWDKMNGESPMVLFSSILNVWKKKTSFTFLFTRPYIVQAIPFSFLVRIGFLHRLNGNLYDHTLMPFKKVCMLLNARSTLTTTIKYKSTLCAV